VSKTTDDVCVGGKIVSLAHNQTRPHHQHSHRSGFSPQGLLTNSRRRPRKKSPASPMVKSAKLRPEHRPRSVSLCTPPGRSLPHPSHALRSLRDRVHWTHAKPEAFMLFSRMMAMTALNTNFMLPVSVAHVICTKTFLSHLFFSKNMFFMCAVHSFSSFGPV